MTGCNNNTLSYCSPAHGGWGIVRVGMLVPESHQLFVCPSACGRHGAIGALTHGNKERLSYLYIDETDIVSGGYEQLIVPDVAELFAVLPKRPRVLMIFVSCLDDLLGTDHESFLSELREIYPDTKFAVGHMNPITTGSKLPPPVNVQCSIYGLLDQSPLKERAVNLIGNHVPISPDCELMQMLLAHGYEVRQIGSCETFAQFAQMASSCLNIVTRPWALRAAQEMQKRLDIPLLYMPLAHDLDELDGYYSALSDMLFDGEAVDTSMYRQKLLDKVQIVRPKLAGMSVSIDSSATVRPFSLGKTLLQNGFAVSEIITQDCIPLEQENQKWLQENSGAAWINPTHHNAVSRPDRPDMLSIGFESGYYNSSRHLVNLVDCEGLYGYHGLCSILEHMAAAAKFDTDTKQMIHEYGLVV